MHANLWTIINAQCHALCEWFYKIQFQAITAQGYPEGSFSVCVSGTCVFMFVCPCIFVGTGDRSYHQMFSSVIVPSHCFETGFPTGHGIHWWLDTWLIGSGMPPPSLPTRTNVQICTTLPSCLKIITIIINDNFIWGLYLHHFPLPASPSNYSCVPCFLSNSDFFIIISCENIKLSLFLCVHACAFSKDHMVLDNQLEGWTLGDIDSFSLISH